LELGIWRKRKYISNDDFLKFSTRIFQGFK
jgi:hypothetical protein